MSDRDLIGYGPGPPHPDWPGHARIALSRRHDIAAHWRERFPASGTAPA